MRHQTSAELDVRDILDPFMADGTTGVAALKLRHFIELDGQRFEVVQTNIARIVGEVRTT